MTIKTKKYQLDSSTYVKLGLMGVMKELWWFWFLPAAIIIVPSLIWPDSMGWWIGTGVILSVLYVLFWWAQFMGATQMEQSKVFFERLSYEIDSRFIMMKKNAKEGMPIKWEMVKSVQVKKDAFVIVLGNDNIEANKIQKFFASKLGMPLYLPFSIFNGDQEKYMMKLLERKGLVTSTKA
ncbi:hypothetical protein KMW28_15615 [Flammeovirga yaeyamensis]|uniref:YcxB-like protein domain-containing protein n=1 Tax=Flammeovirga yaeyamensis TaxID=367791 RepID=A0AAX1N0T6_9BACT|nr:hypothetical protein [Flammeovirga yaeyamensis]MBB3698559.1 hypothetical protein [Flammeovirga yaeyamensis]NMF34092.1 hypothetical protein [Flammeovirga yaeyamensis]QWG01080.1 hypothetical protein KMW28_15615 [Flammeovirga yaeyamensis]